MGGAEWATVAVTLVLGVAGFILARNIGRDLKLRLAERRLAAYERLWALMQPASPYSDPLDREGLRRLHASFTNWYYWNGDGMMLEQTSRNVYFAAKDNLICPLNELIPEKSRVRLKRLCEADQVAERGRLAQRQLSLLRTQLKGDLAIFGQPYGQKLDDEDRAFLDHCRVDISRKPWNEAAGRGPVM